MVTHMTGIDALSATRAEIIKPVQNPGFSKILDNLQKIQLWLNQAAQSVKHVATGADTDTASETKTQIAAAVAQTAQTAQLFSSVVSKVKAESKAPTLLTLQNVAMNLAKTASMVDALAGQLDLVQTSEYLGQAAQTLVDTNNYIKQNMSGVTTAIHGDLVGDAFSDYAYRNSVSTSDTDLAVGYNRVVSAYWAKHPNATNDDVARCLMTFGPDFLRGLGRDSSIPVVIGTTWVPAPSLDDVRAGTAVIKNGMKGESVKYVQGLVGVVADTEYGNDTETAVKAFQEAHTGSLPGMNGIVDKVTITALDSLATGGGAVPSGGVQSMDMTKPASSGSSASPSSKQSVTKPGTLFSKPETPAPTSSFLSDVPLWAKVVGGLGAVAVLFGVYKVVTSGRVVTTQ